MKIYGTLIIGSVILAFFSFSPFEPPTLEAEEAIVIENEFTKAILETSNGCGIGNFLIPVSGDSSQGKPATLVVPYLREDPTIHYVIDTLHGTTVLGTAFLRESWPENTSIISESTQEFPFVIITDSGMTSYVIQENLGMIHPQTVFLRRML